MGAVQEREHVGGGVAPQRQRAGKRFHELMFAIAVVVFSALAAKPLPLTGMVNAKTKN